MKATRPLTRLILSTTAALVVAASAVAAPAAAPAKSAAQNGAQPACPMMGQGQMMPAPFARLHDDLKLDAKQEALWQEADKATREAMTAMRERMRQQHEEFRAKLSQPGADVPALFKQMEEMRSEGQKAHGALRDRWLGIYNSLTAEQKEKVRVFLLSHGGHFGDLSGFGPMHDQGRRDGMEHGRGKHHGMMFDQAPAQPAPNATK